jgi:sulfite exporter TauE/SafE
MSYLELFSIVSIAFLGSLGHCVGMCGGIVVAYSSTKIKKEWSRLYQSIAHILYSSGRITTYTLLGIIFGYLGGVATFNHITNGILLITAGIFMFLAGLSLSGHIRFLTIIEHSLSKSSWYQKNFRELLRGDTLFGFYLLGLLNGLIPCGFVYFFAITAASTGSPFWGGVVMFVFGVSTVPILFSLGFFVGIFRSSSLRNIMVKLATVTIFLYAIFTIYNGVGFIQDENRSVQECH